MKQFDRISSKIILPLVVDKQRNITVNLFVPLLFVLLFFTILIIYIKLYLRLDLKTFFNSFLKRNIGLNSNTELLYYQFVLLQ